METSLLRTPLHGWHATHGGRLVDFAGWEMPVQYSSIVAEHAATRTSVGLFDISHMGRLRLDGPGTPAFLDSIVTRRVIDLRPGGIRYALVTNDQGGVLDDVLVYHVPAADDDTSRETADGDSAGREHWLLVVNASNRQKILAWLQTRLHELPGLSLTDLTSTWAMIAVQGPRALDLIQPAMAIPLATMRYYSVARTACLEHPALVSRTGYTGEDGVELIVPATAAEEIWSWLVERHATPCGLGCRDTLRLEAAMPLYGHELNETTSPLDAGLEFAVNLEGRSFAGHDALAHQASGPRQRQRVGLALAGKRVPREGFPVVFGERAVGVVTSGTFSPTLERPIAMAYVEPAAAAVGTTVSIDIRGRLEPAEVVTLPFYRRSV